MGGSFIPKQKNWQFWEDDAAEPTSSYAAEITTFTMANNSLILRVRVTLAETGGKAGNNVDVAFEYSTNDADFSTPGAANDWDYADGKGTEGNPIGGLLLGDSDTSGEYVETAGGAGTFDYGANEAVEWDIAITPGASIQGSTLYYFRFLINAAEVVLDGGETHPNCTTAEVIAADFIPRVIFIG